MLLIQKSHKPLFGDLWPSPGLYPVLPAKSIISLYLVVKQWGHQLSLLNDSDRFPQSNKYHLGGQLNVMNDSP